MNDFVVKAWQENFKQLVRKEHAGKDDFTCNQEYIIEEGESILLRYGLCYNAFPRSVSFVMIFTNVWFHSCRVPYSVRSVKLSFCAKKYGFLIFISCARTCTTPGTPYANASALVVRKIFGKRNRRKKNRYIYGTLPLFYYILLM